MSFFKDNQPRGRRIDYDKVVEYFKQNCNKPMRMIAKEIGISESSLDKITTAYYDKIAPKS